MRLIEAEELVEHAEVNCESKDFVRKLMDYVADAPTVEPERKKGTWVQISPAKIYECSDCGQTVMTDDIDCYKFCHGCGADMRGEEE